MKLKCKLTERLSNDELVPGEVYKSDSLPGLWMFVVWSNGQKAPVNLRTGQPAKGNLVGWVHCPNAFCVEELEK